MKFKQVLKDYFDNENAIHSYFGYIEDWIKIPIQDSTEYYWLITGETYGARIFYSKEVFTKTMAILDNVTYSSRLYTVRCLPKWVYRAEDFTMICEDTQCDGNKFLSIFDNKKELN